MNHVITVGGLLRAVGGVVGVITMLIGALTWFAGSMSDAPSEGEKAGRSGCLIALAGLALTIICTIGSF